MNDIITLGKLQCMFVVACNHRWQSYKKKKNVCLYFAVTHRKCCL